MTHTHEEHDEATAAELLAEAEALLGRKVRDRETGHTFTVREIGSKDGWPTIGGGEAEPYWSRADDVDELPEHEQTCEVRLPRHLASRLGLIGRLQTVADERGDEWPSESALPSSYAASEEAEAAARELHEEGEIDSPTTCTPEELSEAARERLEQLPLGVSAQTVFRIDLSTGGPVDWLEVVCSGDTPRYEPAGEGEHYEVERVVYHFADWFDHAERTLEGDEAEAAERFAATVIPELME